MKLSTEQVKGLLTKHIFLLSEEEAKALGFILDIKISHFKKNDWCIDFKMTHRLSTVIVECEEGSNCSIGRKRKDKDGCSGLVSWGGVFSFAGAVSVARNFFFRGYELTMQSPEKLKVYSIEEWQENLLTANDLIIAA